MTVFTEGRHPAEFVLSEATGSRSRDNIIAGAAFNAGDILGKITASGKYVRQTIAAADGSQTAVAIALYDALALNDSVSAITRDAEVNGQILRYGGDVDTGPEQLAARVALAAVGIIVRL
jgi:hypothetical protein